MHESTTRQGPSLSRHIHLTVTAGFIAVAALSLGLAAPSGHWGSLTAASQAGKQPLGSISSMSLTSVPEPASQTAATSPADATSPTTASASAKEAIDCALDADINRIITANPQYRLGIALLDLSHETTATRDIREYGDTEKFTAASTAKVLAAAAYYHLVETGQASLDDMLGGYPAEFQLQAMLQQSNNDSWLSIMNAVGYTELTEYAADIAVDYEPTSNTLTAAEMAHILGNLYSGTLLEDGNTAQVLASMQDTNYETLIPAALPADVTVFHKYGLLERELHDAAILVKGGHAYALVIYTEGDDLNSVAERTSIIHEVTQAVTETMF